MLGGVPAAVVGVSKRRGGGQASHLQIYKSQCEGWGRNGFGGRPLFQTDSPFQIFVGSFDGGTAPLCLTRGCFPGTAPHYFQHNLTHSHRDGTVRTLGRSQALGPFWKFGALASASSAWLPLSFLAWRSFTHGCHEALSKREWGGEAAGSW